MQAPRPSPAALWLLAQIWLRDEAFSQPCTGRLRRFWALLQPPLLTLVWGWEQTGSVCPWCLLFASPIWALGLPLLTGLEVQPQTALGGVWLGIEVRVGILFTRYHLYRLYFATIMLHNNHPPTWNDLH